MTQKSASRAYDVVVVGAGVVGLAAGWRAAQRGLRTLVLDSGDAGQGSTRAAAGMLAPVTEADFGEEGLLALNLEAARGYPAFVAELEEEAGMSVGYRACGALTVALDRDDAELLQRLHEFQGSLGLGTEWLSGRECRRLEPGLAPRVVGGISVPGDHQVDPRALAGALAAALARAGAELATHTSVARLTVAAGRVSGVQLESGEQLAADQVVVAAGCWSGELGGLPEGAGVPVRPVKGQILYLRGEPGQDVAARNVGTPEVYVVPRGDGRVVVGATVEERGFDQSVTAGGVFELLRAAYEVLPGITELELVEATAGLRPGSPDNAPIVGPGALAGLVWATGHWRNGVLLAPVTASAVAELLDGAAVPEPFVPFAPDRFARREAPTGERGGVPR